MTEAERAALTVALESQLPYIGLRDVNPDPNLLLYLPAAMVHGAEIVPLGLQDNVLQLACAAPDADLAPLRTRFPRLALELCISPAEEIRDVLAGMRERSG